MPLNYPAGAKEIADAERSDIRAALPASNPWLTKSWINALAVGMAGRINEAYLQIRALERESIPDTATGDYLSKWGNLKGININPATQAQGYATATGTNGTAIPSGTIMASRSGNLYQSTSLATIGTQVIAIASIVRIGSTAYVTTVSPHNMASGMTPAMAGAAQAEYNITAAITVTGLNTYTYAITGAPVTPATGTITATATMASVPLISQGYGAAQSLGNGEVITFATPIVGVDQTAHVQFGEIAGGTDAEAEADYRIRVLQAYQRPFALFNSSQIEATAKMIPGVTRVFVQNATPTRGQVTIYPMRDNDVGSKIPSAEEIAAVRAAILAIKPAHIADADVIVAAPTAVPVNFVFTALSPNTTTMRAAVEEALADLFAAAEVGVNLSEPSWDAAIYNAVDLTTGQSRPTFTLTSPTPPSVNIAAGQIATLGAITWP